MRKSSKFVNMEQMSDEKTFGFRLKQARAMCGFSLRQLEEKMGGIVSYNALSKYEKGQMMPSGSVLVALSKATGQSYGFFFRELGATVTEIKFRKFSTLPKKSQDSIREKAQDFFERYNEIEDILGVDRAFNNPLSGKKIATAEDAEGAAVELREKWKLGLNPLPNIHEMLETNHVKVYEACSDKKFDGFSGWMDGNPVVAISKRLNDQCLTRKRSTFAHELGHLILKDHLASSVTSKDEEKIVQRFSSAFLLPKEMFFSEFGTKRKSLSLQELIDVKSTWGISIAATVYRAHELGCITDSMNKRFWFQYNRNGWRKLEPGDESYIGNEASTRFKQMVWRAVAEENITRSKAAELLNVSLRSLKKSFEVF